MKFLRSISIILIVLSVITLIILIVLNIDQCVMLFIPITISVILWIKSEKKKLNDYKWFIFFVFAFSFIGGYFIDFFVKNGYLNKYGVISTAYIYDSYFDRAGKDWYNEYFYKFKIKDSVIYGSKETVPTSRTFKVKDSVYVIYLPNDYSYSDIFPKTLEPNDYLSENLIKRLINTNRLAKWLIAIVILWLGIYLFGFLISLTNRK